VSTIISKLKEGNMKLNTELIYYLLVYCVCNDKDLIKDVLSLLHYSIQNFDTKIHYIDHDFGISNLNTLLNNKPDDLFRFFKFYNKIIKLLLILIHPKDKKDNRLSLQIKNTDLTETVIKPIFVKIDEL